MSKVRSARGVELHPTASGPVWRIRYQANRRGYRETIGPPRKGDKGDDLTLKEARARLKLRRSEVQAARRERRPYLPPREREAQERQSAEVAAKQAEDARAPFLFERVAERFMAARSASYSRPAAVRGMLDHLGKAFVGRYLDGITRRDVVQYALDRKNRTGPFAGWAHEVAERPAAMELGKLSALYKYLDRVEGIEIPNPCRELGHVLADCGMSYRPKRRPVIPSDDEREAIFEAALAYQARRKFMTAETWHAACVSAYFMFLRPESELCQIRHGDVVFATDPRARFNTDSDGQPVGWVTFEDTKTDVPRAVPLHPRAEAALAGIMLPCPDGPTEAWAATPIFRRAAGSPWNKDTYRKAWQATLAAVVESHPRLAGMVFRDFRNAGITDTRAAGTDGAIAAKVAGHSAAMSARYVQAPGRLAVDAVLRLGANPGRTQGRTSAKVTKAVSSQNAVFPGILERETGFEPATLSLGS